MKTIRRITWVKKSEIDKLPEPEYIRFWKEYYLTEAYDFHMLLDPHYTQMDYIKYLLDHLDCLKFSSGSIHLFLQIVGLEEALEFLKDNRVYTADDLRECRTTTYKPSEFTYNAFFSKFYNGKDWNYQAVLKHYNLEIGCEFISENKLGKRYHYRLKEISEYPVEPNRIILLDLMDFEYPITRIEPMWFNHRKLTVIDLEESA